MPIGPKPTIDELQAFRASLARRVELSKSIEPEQPDPNLVAVRNRAGQIVGYGEVVGVIDMTKSYPFPDPTINPLDVRPEDFPVIANIYPTPNRTGSPVEKMLWPHQWQAAIKTQLEKSAPTDSDSNAIFDRSFLPCFLGENHE